MMGIIPIFIGFDAREASAYHVCCQSIIERASVPVAFIPLALNLLREYDDSGHKDGSNAFIYSRFLVPYLSRWGTQFKHAIYLDGDMILRDDIAKLWELRRHDMGVQVVQHDYKTKYAKKYLNAVNSDYPMKNWSSVMLWNNSFAENRKLTPEFVAGASGQFLHRFEWLAPSRIGALPVEWNWLVGEYPLNQNAKLLHHTLGTPCFSGYEKQEGGDEWYKTLMRALTPLGAENGAGTESFGFAAPYKKVVA